MPKEGKEKEIDWKAAYIQKAADAENLRKDFEKDLSEAKRYGGFGMLSALIPSLDALDLALGAKAAGQEAENYKKGFAMVAAGIEDALKGEGVSTLVPSVGQRFDATTMRSVSSDPSRPDGTVASVSLKGYVLNGRLVRPAVVSVGSKKETEEKPEEKT